MMLLAIDWKITISDIINSIIAIAAILTLLSQIIQSRRNADFGFQPNFIFRKFCNHEHHIWSPMVCDGASKESTNKCNKDHWFNFYNDSSGVAFNLEIFLLHQKEIKGFKYKDIESKRTLKLNALLKDSQIQYKLSPGTVPCKYYNQKENDSFYIVLSYETISRFNKFIQVVELGCEPQKQQQSIDDWKGAIKFSKGNVVYFEKISWMRKVFTRNQKVYSNALEKAQECENDLD
ncbi:MAG: hypothetical protein IT237_01565 [Bacteroidia bacterium]|nr:hypothetical protein [Bacteroidia bacterium]